MRHPPRSVEGTLNVLLAEYLRGAANATSAILKKQIDQIKIELGSGIPKYLQSIKRRVSHVKTLISSESPLSVGDVYVDIELSNGGNVFSGEVVLERFFTSSSANSSLLLVSGGAGSGKTMFMRYSVLQIINVHNDIFPIYIELRRINKNDIAPDSFLHVLLKQLQIYLAFLTLDQLAYCLIKMRIVLFLDGFDEVEFQHRDDLRESILRFTERFVDVPVLVTSRPDESFGKWTIFKVLEIEPPSIDKAKQVALKLPFELAKIDKFVSDIDSKLHLSHKEFLENPLLVTLMSMTYSESLSIPNKKNLFYEFAFNALFYKHDAHKEGIFTRRFYSSMAQDDFRSLFSCFCALTYIQEQVEFSEAEIINAISSSAETQRVMVDPRNYLKDLCESTSLIVVDGLSFSFVHRSFQEYFTAKFLSENDFIDIKAYIDAVIRRSVTDNVIALVAEIAFPKLERLWVLPSVNELISLVRDLNISETPLNYALLFYDNCRVSEHALELSFNDMPRPYILKRIIELYDNLIPSKIGQETRKHKEAIREIYNNMSIKGVDIPLDNDVNDVNITWLHVSGWVERFQKTRDHIIELKEFIVKERQSRIESLDIFLRKEIGEEIDQSSVRKRAKKIVSKKVGTKKALS